MEKKTPEEIIEQIMLPDLLKGRVTVSVVVQCMRDFADQETAELREENSKYKPVKAVRDESGHWYIIPNELMASFNLDSEDEDMIYSGKFDDVWGKYRTGGDLNLEQLYVKI